MLIDIGGKNIEGAKTSLRMSNLVENKNVPVNLIDGKDYDCLTYRDKREYRKQEKLRQKANSLESLDITKVHENS